MDQDGDVGDDDEEDWDVDGEDDIGDAIFNIHIAIYGVWTLMQ